MDLTMHVMYFVSLLIVFRKSNEEFGLGRKIHRNTKGIALLFSPQFHGKFFTLISHKMH